MEVKKLDEIIEEHRSEDGALISILHDIQRQEEYLTEESISYLSDKLNRPKSDISRVATYFERAFRLEPEKKHTIRVCRGTTCHIKHSDQVLAEIGEELSKDGKNREFFLGEARCLGCCTSSGPVVEIDGEIYDSDSAKSTIVKLKGENK